MTVRSEAYDMRCVFGSMGDEMSCMYGLKSVGETTAPCGTAFVKCLVVEGLTLYLRMLVSLKETWRAIF